LACGAYHHGAGRLKRARRHFPITDEVVYQHLIGKKTIGVYPMLEDETCRFLAPISTKIHGKKMRSRLCKPQEAPASTHIWSDPDPGREATSGSSLSLQSPRSLPGSFGCFILTQAMERRHRLPLTSYDRLFPNQDTMPKGGFGNLIALPLQWVPQRSKNSEFVDESLNS